MKEDFLYYLWENRLLKGQLCTVEGEAIEVLSTGYRNTNSGPDFQEVIIKIGETVWAGNVEIHVLTSDWNRHEHQLDKAYKSVVLHVVYENDLKKSDIPVLEVKGKFEESLFDQYQHFISSKGWIPCKNAVAAVKKFTWLSWLDRLLVERLEQKSAIVDKMILADTMDWENTLYRFLMRYMGMKVNNDSFEFLSNILPFKVLIKQSDNLLQLEAMLFGCAGFLEKDFDDAYPILLKREFEVLKAKFDLLTMDASRWKFMRMRPGNFPTIRLAQLAQLIYRNGTMFSKILNAQNDDTLKFLFNVSTSVYWETHFNFGNESRKSQKRLGDSASDVLIINAVVPVLFCYGRYHSDASICEKAVGFLEHIQAENNTVIRNFISCGVTPDNAIQSQAMLQLYDHYCKKRRCLECRIGSVVMSHY
jgi:Protein of unknown function (DUF2851).